MSEAQNEQHKCSICMDVLGANGGVSTLECGHPFCSECLARWEARSTLCPVCRADQRTLGRRARNREEGIEDDDEDEPSQEVPQPPLEQLTELMNQLSQLMHGSQLQAQPGPRPLGGLSPGLHAFPGGVQYAWGTGSRDGSTLHFSYPGQQRRQHGGPGEEQDPEHAESLYREQLRRVVEAFGLPSFLEAEEQHPPEEPSAEPEVAESPATDLRRAEDAINVLQVRLNSLPQRPWYLSESSGCLEEARQSLQRCRDGSLPPHEARRILQTVTGDTRLIERKLEDLLEARDARQQQRQGPGGSPRAASEAAAGGGSAQPASSAPPLEALLGGEDAQPPPRTERDFRRWWAQQQDHPHPMYHASGRGAQRVPTPQAFGQSQAGLPQQQQAGQSGRHQQQATPSRPAASAGQEEEGEQRWGWGALAAGAAAVGAAALSSWWKGRNQGQQQQQQEGQFSAGQQASASGRQRGAQGQAPEDSAQTNAYDIFRRLCEAQEARRGEGPAEEGQPANRSPDVLALLVSAYEAYRAGQASGAHRA